MKEPHFTLFTDGSCGRGKNDMGAWSAYVAGKQVRKLLYGVIYPATISRCEMTPILEGLRWIKYITRGKRSIHVRSYSDSEFVVKTLSCGYEPNKNLDLWAALEEIRKGLRIDFRYRERNSHFYMQVCDAVCSRLRRRTIAQADEMLCNWKEPEKIIPIKPLITEEDDTVKEGLIDAYRTHS